MALKRMTQSVKRAFVGLGHVLWRIDPADVLLFSGLASLTLAAGLVHVGLALVIFGLGSFYLGLAAGRRARS